MSDHDGALGDEENGCVLHPKQKDWYHNTHRYVKFTEKTTVNNI
jgi:hypothetical protein